MRTEISAAHEDQRGDVVEHVHEHDRHRQQRAEDHHLPGVGLVDRLEQLIERQDEEHSDDLVNQFARDAETEEPIMESDVVGRRRGVARHDQLAGYIEGRRAR